MTAQSPQAKALSLGAAACCAYFLASPNEVCLRLQQAKAINQQAKAINPHAKARSHSCWPPPNN